MLWENVGWMPNIGSTRKFATIEMAKSDRIVRERLHQ